MDEEVAAPFGFPETPFPVALVFGHSLIPVVGRECMAHRRSWLHLGRRGRECRRRPQGHDPCLRAAQAPGVIHPLDRVLRGCVC